MPKAKDALLNHEYDGIREYDNPTPGWWHAILAVTMLFSIFYFAFFEFSPVCKSPQQVLQDREIVEIRRQFAEIGDLKPDAPTIFKMMADPKWMAFGESVFRGNCVSCHGNMGQGIVGPNLTDDVYKNVKKIEDIPRVVAEGAANGAMPSWKTRLHPNEVVLVASYVATLRGRNIAGRPPEGELAAPWKQGADSASAAQDSANVAAGKK